jgi:hypothetical protein
MALDAITMSLLAGELDQALQGSRIDKIHQPSRDEVVFHMRKRDGNIKLLLSARSGSARICLTNESFENPQTPPSFCMLLRKYLSGARFVGAASVEGERIIMLTFTATSEMGDTVNIDIAAELMWELALDNEPTEKRERQPLTQNEEQILSLFDQEPIHIDTLLERSGLASSELSLHLMTLELSGAIRPLRGNMYEKL